MKYKVRDTEYVIVEAESERDAILQYFELRAKRQTNVSLTTEPLNAANKTK